MVRNMSALGDFDFATRETCLSVGVNGGTAILLASSILRHRGPGPWHWTPPSVSLQPLPHLLDVLHHAFHGLAQVHLRQHDEIRGMHSVIVPRPSEGPALQIELEVPRRHPAGVEDADGPEEARHDAA